MNLEKAIELARQNVLKKIEDRKLFADIEETNDFSDGDCETLYSIAVLYAQFAEDVSYNEAIDAIEKVLEEEFEDYI